MNTGAIGSAAGARVVAPYAHPLWDAALAAGVPLASVRSLWQRQELGEADVPVPAYLALLERASAVGKAGFGWRLGGLVKPTSYGVNGILLLACATLGQALEQVLRFESLVHDLGRSQVQREGDRVVYRWRNDCAGHAAASELTESVFAGIHTCAQWLVGRAIEGFALGFMHDTGAARRALIEASTQGPVRGCQEVNAAWFPAEVLEWPLPQANTALMPMLQQHAQALLQARHPQQGGLRAALRQRITARLGSGPVRLGDVAADLALSKRTLQRRLLQEGLAFQQVLDDTRHELACHYLGHSALPLAEVAALLGYQDAPAFHHAFRAWQGAGPGQYRRERAGQHGH